MPDISIVTSHWSHPGQESASEDILRRVLISVQDKPTVGAGVHALRQGLAYFAAATTALYACSCGTYFHDLRTGSFGLVAKNVHEAGPASIGDRTSQPVVLDHPLDVQALHRDQSVRSDEIQSGLVMMLPSEIRDASMKATNLGACLAAVLAASFTATDDSLCDAQGGQSRLEVSRVFYTFAIGSSEEGFKSNVNTDGWEPIRRHRHVAQVAGQHDVPLVSFTFHGRGFDRSLNESVDVDAYLADMLDTQFAPVQTDAVTVGWKHDTVEAITGLEARITRLPAALAATKEVLVRLVESAHRRLCRGEVEAGEILVVSAKLFELGRLINVANTAPMHLVLGLSLLQAEVVQAPVRLQGDPQFTKLIRVGVEPELERFAHLLTLLPFDVASNGVALVHVTNIHTPDTKSRGSAVI